MKFLRSLLMGTGGVVLAGMALALLAPKAVHAIAATAVQVVNTPASPVITEEVSLQASQIVTVQCFLSPGVNEICNQVLPNGANLGSTTGPNGGYLVPLTQYFVLKSIDTYLVSGGPTVFFIGLPARNPLGFESVLLQANGQVSFSSGIVVGPGQELVIYAQSGSVLGNATLHGYLTANNY